jgi:hypothetical protein
MPFMSFMVNFSNDCLMSRTETDARKLIGPEKRNQLRGVLGLKG